MAVGRLRRIIGNAASLFTSDVVNRGTTFLIYVLIARYLGSREFGQMSLALTLYNIAGVAAAFGLRTFITREVARERTDTDRYVVNGSMLVVVSSLLSIIALFFFVRGMAYAADTALIVLLLSLGLVPSSLSAVCEAVFQAWERMHYIAYTNVIAHIAKAAFSVLLLLQGYGLYEVILVFLATRVGILGMQWWLLLRRISRPPIRINLRFSIDIAKKAVTFMGINSVVAIWTSLNIILLSKLADEHAVGLFSAASQLMLPVTLVFQSIVLSVFPVMCRKFEDGVQSLKRIFENLVELLLIVAVPTAVGLFFVADSALLLIYGDADFLSATPALQIMVWSVISRAPNRALGQVLLASHREQVSLRIVVINTFISLAFGLVLISQFGVVGAAISALLTRVVDLLQHHVPVSRLLSGIPWARLSWKPVVAAAVMGGFLMMLGDQNLAITIAAGAALYTLSLAGLIVVSIGGMQQLKAKYQYLRSD